MPLGRLTPAQAIDRQRENAVVVFPTAFGTLLAGLALVVVVQDPTAHTFLLSASFVAGAAALLAGNALITVTDLAGDDARLIWTWLGGDFGVGLLGLSLIFALVGAVFLFE